MASDSVVGVFLAFLPCAVDFAINSHAANIFKGEARGDLTMASKESKRQADKQNTEKTCKQWNFKLCWDVLHELKA
jgi:hypothetical protein